jgi:hypothetical protein
VNQTSSAPTASVPPSVAADRLAWFALAALSLVAMLLAYRPYAGIAHDGQIYVGFAMAALDPQGVGRDLMFVKDGQADLSLFPRATAALMRHLGPSATSRWLTLAGLFVWLGGASLLFSRLAGGRVLWAALACVLVLEPTYGGFDILGYLGSYLSPRPLAEALVLAGLAALIDRRRILGLVVLGIAGVVHPVMTLPGVAVGFILLAAEDRRWWVAAGAAIVAVAVAAGLHLPMADRLLIRIDPAWMEMLQTRNTYLFPGLWTFNDYGRVAVQLATVVIAAGVIGDRTEGRSRLALLAIAGIGLCGVLLSAAFGEAWPSLLVAQLQPWRAGWLLAVAANGGLAVAAIGLWRAGGGYRTALAALVMAWLGQGLLGAAFGIMAVAVFVQAQRGRQPAPSKIMATTISLAVAGMAAAWMARAWPQLHFLQTGIAAGIPLGWWELLKTGVPQGLAAALVVLVALTPPWPRPAVRSGAALSAIAAVLALLAWDHRSAVQRMIDEAQGAPALRAMIGSAPGPVQWIDGSTHAWLLAGRANWSSSLQGASIVFSRPLAVDWDARLRTLMALGLAQEGDRSPYVHPAAQPNHPSRAGVLSLCSRADAPVAVIMAAPAPPGLPVRLWQAPGVQYDPYIGADNRPGWRPVTAYAVVSCPVVRRGLSGLRP